MVWRAQELGALEGFVKSAAAAALHGLDKADTRRKMDLVQQRIASISKVCVPRASGGHFPPIRFDKLL